MKTEYAFKDVYHYLLLRKVQGYDYEESNPGVQLSSLWLILQYLTNFIPLHCISAGDKIGFRISNLTAGDGGNKP